MLIFPFVAFPCCFMTQKSIFDPFGEKSPARMVTVNTYLSLGKSQGSLGKGLSRIPSVTQNLPKNELK